MKTLEELRDELMSNPSFRGSFSPDIIIAALRAAEQRGIVRAAWPHVPYGALQAA